MMIQPLFILGGWSLRLDDRRQLGTFPLGKQVSSCGCGRPLAGSQAVADHWQGVRLAETLSSEDHPKCGLDGAKLRAYRFG